MKLYVGLGNPGKEYIGTRHNVGFAVLDTLMAELGILDNQKEERFGLLNKTKINGETVYLLKPLTYMNLSGRAVKAVVDYYKIPIEDIVIIHDDMDFPVGHFKLKRNGGPAGHNGIKSIIECLGTEEFKRIRLGIGRGDNAYIDYVLGKFGAEEKELIREATLKTCEALKEYPGMSFSDLQTKYNREEK